MPFNMESITEVFTVEQVAKILQTEFPQVDDAWGDSSKTFFLASRNIKDKKSGRNVGKYVFTLFANLKEGKNELLDFDIVLNNETPAELEFLQKIPQQSPFNEYYEVQILNTNQHLTVETVNRFLIPPEIIGTKQTAYCSAFPSELTIFDDMDALNSFFEFSSKGIKVGQLDLYVSGLSNTYISPSNTLNVEETENNNSWSLVVGTIKSYEEVILTIGNNPYDVIIAQLETALGLLPTMIGTDVFDTSTIAVDKLVAMKACIKANFSSGKYPK